MPFVLPLPGLTFIYSTSRLLSLCLCYPSSLFFFFSPALASSCLYLCSELKQRSLNHIRYGSFAIPHPLCRNSAPALTLLTFWLLFPLVPSFLHPYFFRHHTHYRPISRKQRWLKYLLHYRTSTTPSILDPPTFFNHSFFCAALCTLPSSPLSKLNWTKRLVCARLASSLLRGPEPQAGANILPPSGSLSFRFFWSGQPQNLISQHLSHCAVTHFFFFFFPFATFSRNGWQPLTCSSLWTGWTLSETRSSRRPKCCAHTSTPSRISLWVAGELRVKLCHPVQSHLAQLQYSRNFRGKTLVLSQESIKPVSKPLSGSKFIILFCNFFLFYINNCQLAAIWDII